MVKVLESCPKKVCTSYLAPYNGPCTGTFTRIVAHGTPSAWSPNVNRCGNKSELLTTEYYLDLSDNVSCDPKFPVPGPETDDQTPLVCCDYLISEVTTGADGSDVGVPVAGGIMISHVHIPGNPDANLHSDAELYFILKDEDSKSVMPVAGPVSNDQLVSGVVLNSSVTIPSDKPYYLYVRVCNGNENDSGVICVQIKYLSPSC